MAKSARTAHLRAALREHTQSAHQRLDQHPRLVALTNPAISTTAYVDALQALYPGFSWLDHKLCPPHPELAVKVVPRAVLLAADIRAMGATVPAPLAQPSSVPMASAAFWLGLCYVHEGARLGGQAIYRELCGRSDLALSFFHSAKHASAGSALWQTIETLTTAEQQRALLAGADCGFQAVLAGVRRTKGVDRSL